MIDRVADHTTRGKEETAPASCRKCVPDVLDNRIEMHLGNGRSPQTAEYGFAP